MLFDTVAAVGVSRTDGTVVRALWSRITVRGETWRQLRIHIPQKVFLFETKPDIVVVIVNRGAPVRRMRRAVRVHHLAHNKKGILAIGVWVDRHWLQQTVGAAAVCLLG